MLKTYNFFWPTLYLSFRDECFNLHLFQPVNGSVVSRVQSGHPEACLLSFTVSSADCKTLVILVSLKLELELREFCRQSMMRHCL